MFGLYRHRRNYWSCSKFASWILKISGCEPKPPSATSEGWEQWHKINASRNKIGYWIAEEGLDIAQDVVMFIPDVYHNVWSYLRNRFIEKSHYLPTKLEAGQYHEISERMLHGLFETLVEFVEVEKAHMMWLSDAGKWDSEDNESKKKVNKKDYQHSRKHGLRYIDWEISLGEESPYQSQCANETKELYIWWKDIRPQRAEPYDDPDNRWGDDWTSDRVRTPEYKEWSDQQHELEEQYHDEDTAMLIRLIHIRRGLWT